MHLSGNFGLAATHKTHDLIMGNSQSKKPLDGYQHCLRRSQFMRKQCYLVSTLFRNILVCNLRVLEEYISLFVFISGWLHLLAIPWTEHLYLGRWGGGVRGMVTTV